VIAAGSNDTDAPTGRPDALNATLCANPLVTVVLIVLVAGWPAVTVATAGLALNEKSFTAGLNVAMPAAQYILVLTVPVTFCALVELATVEAATTLATLLPERLVCWG
jgi:hypothetical protein